jgi:hypothetical protein
MTYYIIIWVDHMLNILTIINELLKNYLRKIEEKNNLWYDFSILKNILFSLGGTVFSHMLLYKRQLELIKW